MVTRFEIERAVLASTLPPGCRHLVHVLCVRIDAQAGVILAAYQPSLAELARDTGRNKRTIQRYLNVLEHQGWITRQRPLPELARRLHARTRYAVRIPDDALQARGGTPPGLGTVRRAARGGTPPELGTGSPEARGTAPHRSSGSSGSSAGQIEMIIKTICEKTGITITPEWAGRIREQILGARDNVRHPEAYLRRAILEAPPDTYIPHDSPTPPCERCGQPGHLKSECPY
jgi:hypothetical protein